MKKMSEELSQNLFRSRVCHDGRSGFFPLTYVNGPGESETLIT